MALPPLADLAAVRELLAEPLSVAQEARAVRLLSAISAEVRAITGRPWTTSAGDLAPGRPDLLAVTVERATERALRNPQRLSAENLGDYGRRFDVGGGSGTPGVYLDAAERAALLDLVDVGDIVSVPTERDVYAGPTRADDYDTWGW